MTATAERASAAFASSSTRRAAAIPLPTMTSGSLTASNSCCSDARPGETCRARRHRTLAQIVPPCERQADRVERQIDFQRQLRTAGDGDRLAEAARDQVAAAGADRADETERGAALDAGGLQSECPAGFAVAPGLCQILLAENRRDHPVGRAVADAGGDEKDQEHHQEAGEILDADE